MTTSHLSPQPSIQLAPLPSYAEPQLASADSPFITFQMNFLQRSNQWLYKFQQIMKRSVDIVGALLGLVMIAPLLAVIALLIKLDSPGPVFYLSQRIGKNYRSFNMIKFRTMTVDADSRRDTLREEANLNGELFKITNDPRVTGIGKVLRALSLDELPQLFNVLRGEMSMVGPRPLPPDESRMFEEPYTLRFHVYPGMTGLWQVSGRSNLAFKQLCNLEMRYVMDWSLWEDFKILFKTLPAVLASRGAC